MAEIKSRTVHELEIPEMNYTVVAVSYDCKPEAHPTVDFTIRDSDIHEGASCSLKLDEAQVVALLDLLTIARDSMRKRRL